MLQFYKFNPAFFGNLVKLADDVWNTNNRISRLSLIKTINYYKPTFNVEEHKNLDNYNKYFSAETRKSLFNLFRNTYENYRYLSELQIDEARIISNLIIKDVILTTEAEKWLCDNFQKSSRILNRTLRYPRKSDIITNWAKENFNHKQLITRRAELVSWLIDENIDYQIDKKTLADDFEHINELDMKAIDNYKTEVAINEEIEKEFDQYWFEKYGNERIPVNEGGYHEDYELSSPELKLTPRPYINQYRRYGNDYSLSKIPDFNKLRKDFYDNIALHQKITMIWAINFSRIDNKEKTTLLKKYYTPETYYSMLKVCKRMQNIPMLKWLLQKTEEEQKLQAANNKNFRK